MRSCKAILLSFGVVLLFTIQSISQDNVLYRYHYLHQGLLNPAVTGSEFFPVANLTFHKQWAGFPQSPFTLVASTSVRIGNFDFYNPQKLINTTNLRTRERIGIGFALYSDRNGPLIDRGFLVAYAYHLDLGQGRLSLGLSGSGEQKALDESLFHPAYPDDPILSMTRESIMLLNANVGVYYYSSGLFGGFAIHHLIPVEERLQTGTSVKPDYMLHGGYLFSSLGDPRLEISSNIRYLDYKDLEFDLHVRAYIQSYHWVAISVRSYKALAMHLGIKVSQLHMAYTYEANLTNMVHYNLGTHAIHLGMNLGMRRTKGF